MDGFAWAENNLGVRDPRQLQDERLNIYYAPDIAPGERVVDLATGRIVTFHDGEARPGSGYYAPYDNLERWARRHDLNINEVNGQVTTQPHNPTAGDPLHTRG